VKFLVTGLADVGVDPKCHTNLYFREDVRMVRCDTVLTYVVSVWLQPHLLSTSKDPAVSSERHVRRAADLLDAAVTAVCMSGRCVNKRFYSYKF
jgi:hypothetical protein